jgi:hypothetical protein
MNLINDRGEFDEREIEWMKYLACSATKQELEQMLQEALDGKLGCLIKLAKHYHKLQDDERLSRAIDALLTEPEEEAKAT